MHLEFDRQIGASAGWLKLWTNHPSTPTDPTAAQPVLQAQISAANFAAIASPYSYIGFTAASGGGVSTQPGESLNISNWTVTDHGDGTYTLACTPFCQARINSRCC